MGFYGNPPVIKHGWLENPPFMDDFPTKTSIYMGFSIAMFGYQRVSFSSSSITQFLWRFLVYSTTQPQLAEISSSYIYICMYICACVYIYIYIYVYVYIYNMGRLI